MASITAWTRLEPSPRAANIEPSLRAAIRDPLWMLTRQWQMGEFDGEDAGSPAYISVKARRSSMTAWRPRGGAWRDIAPGLPLEPQMESEPFTPDDLSLSVELGQTFERILAGSGAPVGVRDAVRAAFPLALPAGADADARRFFAICGGRSTDGVKLHQAILGGAVPVIPGLPPGVLTEFRDWVAEVFGRIEVRDPEIWDPSTLSSRAEVRADLPGGGVGVLAATPSAAGGLEWHSFDFIGTIEDDPVGEPQQVSASLFPVSVSFRGMPNSRWWDFENNRTDFGGLSPNKKDLGQLLVMEFMILHSNDWFVIPFDLPVNSLCLIDRVEVVDVFGDKHEVSRAQNLSAAPGERWTAFSHARPESTELANFFVLPPTAAAVAQPGHCVEDIGFFRDPAANLSWAVERQTEGGIGQPVFGHERAAEHAPAPQNVEVSLWYLIETAVPEHWFPFVPMQVAPGEVAFQLGAMLLPSDPRTPIPPRGRILRPASLSPGAVYTLREEEIPRAGLTVKRVLHRTRWTDGSTHVWLARRRTAGRGEGSSHLRFDQAITSK